MSLALVTKWIMSTVPAKGDKGNAVLSIQFVRAAISMLEDKQQSRTLHLQRWVSVFIVKDSKEG